MPKTTRPSFLSFGSNWMGEQRSKDEGMGMEGREPDKALRALGVLFTLQGWVKATVMGCNENLADGGL